MRRFAFEAVDGSGVRRHGTGVATDEFDLDKNKKHTIEAVVDRIVVGQSDSQGRIADSVETALKLGNGVILVSIIDGEELLFSEHFACVYF